MDRSLVRCILGLFPSLPDRRKKEEEEEKKRERGGKKGKEKFVFLFAPPAKAVPWKCFLVFDEQVVSESFLVVQV